MSLFPAPFLQDNDPRQTLKSWATILNSNAAKRTETATYAASGQDSWILANGTGGAFTVTLPNAGENPGKELTVTRTNSGANAITMAAGAGDTLVGSGSLGSQGSSRTVRSDGVTTWYVVASI